jgi:hypothetical protein
MKNLLRVRFYFINKNKNSSTKEFQIMDYGQVVYTIGYSQLGTVYYVFFFDPGQTMRIPTI